MLVEVNVCNLGVIDELSLVLGPGMTVLTGETGAGKTLVVEAIELLVGGRPGGMLVRPGAAEARVEGRFITPDGDEVILARVVPAAGRSRAYVDGRMAPVGALTSEGERLVDLHGQHEHQSLLAPAVQRAALDAYGAVDRGALEAAREKLRQIDQDLVTLGGDARARARELDLLRYQLAELDTAGLGDPDEEDGLAAEEDVLAQAEALREAAVVAYDALVGEGGAGESLGGAIGGLRGRGPFAEVTARLAAAAAEVADAAADLRALADTISEDPVRLEAVQGRRHLLRELRRKYGESLADVIDYTDMTRSRVAELEAFEQRAGQLDAARAEAASALTVAATAVANARRAAAPGLGTAIERHLRELALPHARFAVDVNGEPPADDVVFGLGANPGEPVLPLSKVASGGELARTMLAARLVLTAGPPTLVFDEVDAGIGGAAAVAVGQALAGLCRGDTEQVLVVTHLPQVAAYADAHIAVTKLVDGGRTLAVARLVEGEDRVTEISRMLSGRPDSTSARTHAAELLATAAAERGAS